METIWLYAWPQRLTVPYWVSEVKVVRLCPTFCDPMGYTVRGILQARILEWVAILFSRGSSQPRDRTKVSHIAGRFFTSWAMREAPCWIITVLNLSLTFTCSETSFCQCIQGLSSLYAMMPSYEFTMRNISARDTRLCYLAHSLLLGKTLRKNIF